MKRRFETKLNPKVLFTILFVCFFSLLSCGGGGGGGVNSTPSLSYTGSIDKALIDESNAVSLTTEAVELGIEQHNIFSDFRSLTNKNDSVYVYQNNLLDILDKLQNSVKNFQVHSEIFSQHSKAIHSEQETRIGSCGGESRGVFYVDDSTGEFWGDFDYINYCESNETMNGKMDFSGRINLINFEIERMTFNLDYLVFADSFNSIILDGTMSFLYQTSGFTVTMDLLAKVGQDNEVFWINDYRIEVKERINELSLNISGNFYDPKYGYVTLSTQQELIIDVNDMLPTSGVLIATGRNGIAGGATHASLICYPTGVFEVKVDTNGDGSYDWNSGQLYWEGGIVEFRYKIDPVYLQYRNYEFSENRYSAWLGIMKNDKPAIAKDVDILSFKLFDDARNLINLSYPLFYEGNPYYLYDCRQTTCTERLTADSGFTAIIYNLPEGRYTMEAQSVDGEMFSVDIQYFGQLELPFVSSVTMESFFTSENDLILSWTNPTNEFNWNEVDQLRIVMTATDSSEVLYISLNPDDNQVTIPAALIQKAENLGHGVIDNWHIQTRAIDSNGMNWARGYSNWKSIAQSYAAQEWFGTTDQGGEVSFFVSEGQIKNFAIYSYLTGGIGGYGWLWTEVGPTIPISGGSFVFNGYSFDVTGTFLDLNTCSGTWDYHDSYTGYSSGTWIANPR
jgi:hypothetical protein